MNCGASNSKNVFQKKGCQKGGITKSKRLYDLFRVSFLKDEIFFSGD